MKVSIVWATSFFILLVLSLLIQILQKKVESNKDSLSQVECGFNIMNPSHIPFSFQFFLIALLFLIFDIEIALILSYPLEMNSSKTIFTMAFFITLLFIGLIYEWQKSKISWSS